MIKIHPFFFTILNQKEVWTLTELKQVIYKGIIKQPIDNTPEKKAILNYFMINKVVYKNALEISRAFNPELPLDVVRQQIRTLTRCGLLKYKVYKSKPEQNKYIWML